MINKIQLVNIVWVVGSLVLLYDRVNGDRYTLIASFVWIAILFFVMFYAGQAYKSRIISSEVTGEPAKGQWDR